MSDSTTYLDSRGIRREVAIQPPRHLLTDQAYRSIADHVDLGEPETAVRQGWDTLLRVHGARAVLRGVLRCAQQSALVGRITSDHVLAVLDNRHEQREGHGEFRRSRVRPAATPGRAADRTDAAWA